MEDITESLSGAVLTPHFSVLMLSHQRPVLLIQALESVLGQSYKDFDLTVVDSGALTPMLLEQYGDRISVLESQDELLPPNTGIGPWLMNRFMPNLQGPWIVHLGDDDLYWQDYLETFANAIRLYPDQKTFVTGQVRVVCDALGRLQGVKGEHPAVGTYTTGRLDCHVDGMQFCFHKSVWDKLCVEYDHKPWPEEIESVKHADGLFMERAVKIQPAMPVAGIHCVNRRSPSSKFAGTT